MHNLMTNAQAPGTDGTYTVAFLSRMSHAGHADNARLLDPAVVAKI